MTVEQLLSAKATEDLKGMEVKLNAFETNNDTNKMAPPSDILMRKSVKLSIQRNLRRKKIIDFDSDKIMKIEMLNKLQSKVAAEKFSLDHLDAKIEKMK